MPSGRGCRRGAERKRTPLGLTTTTIALVVGAALTIIAPRLGWAHATLISADPADRAVIASAPEKFTLTFNEPVTPLVLKLLSTDRPAVLLDHYQLQDRTLLVRAPASLSDGTYRLTWRIVSADGHPVAGSTLFVIGSQTAGSMPEAGDTADPHARAMIWIVRIMLYGGVFFGVGGAFFCAWTDVSAKTRWRPRAFLWASLLLGLVATVVSVGAQGLDAFGAPLAQLTQPIVWQTGFATSWGTTAAIGLFGILTCICAVVIGRKGYGRALTSVGLCSLGLALASSGHASTAAPRFLTQPCVFLHVVSIAAWTGALVPLAVAIKGDGEDALMALRRFSRAAPVVVAIIVVTGVILSVIQLGWIGALWATDYGRILLGKLAMVAALLAIAAWNRLALTPRITQGNLAARRQLVRAVAIELILVAIIFALVATWRFTPPPRALAAPISASSSLHLHTAQVTADVTFTPARAGRVSVSMIILTGNLGPLDAQDVQLTLANPGAGVEPITRRAYKPGDGTWKIDAMTLPLPGLWSVRLDMIMPDATTATLEDTIEIGP